MEILPVEITDKIFNEIFCENPRGLYELRRLSKTWKDMIDRCTARLVKVWCKKCSDAIPKNHLDDFVRTRLPQSWQEYCSNELALPHIARHIYESRNDFPNLVGNPHLTEICSSSERDWIDSYAVNDKYLAISYSTTHIMRYVLRVYSLNDLTHCIREYPIWCLRLDFYTTDNQIFILLRKGNIPNMTVGPIMLAEFLVNGSLIPAHLVLNDGTRYVIINNECFTYCWNSNWFQHHQLTANGFEPSPVVQISFPNGSKDRKMMNIQLLNSNLFVFGYCRSKNRRDVMIVYQYQTTRQPNGKLFFSDPIIYEKRSSDKDLRIRFGSDNIYQQNSICDLYSRQFNAWLRKFFQQDKALTITIYVYHVLIVCSAKFIVFRGNVRQLMDYAVEISDPGSKCTAIDVKTFPVHSRYIHIIHTESEPCFLVVTTKKVFTVNLIP